MADINALIEKYEQSPYPYVALAFCLKNREDPSWKKVAEKAKHVLETFLSIEPRVLTIDVFYGSLIKDILEEKIALEDTGFFVKWADGRYRSKNSPPP